MSHLKPEELSAFLDGELDARRTRRVEEHMGTCARCAQELAELRAVDGFLKDQPAPPLSPEDARVFAPQVAARITERATRGIPRRLEARRRWLTLPRLLPIASGVLAVLLLVVVGMRLRPLVERRALPESKLSAAPEAAKPKVESTTVAAARPARQAAPVPPEGEQDRMPGARPLDEVAARSGGAVGTATDELHHAPEPPPGVARVRAEETRREAYDLSVIRENEAVEPVLIAAAKPIFRLEALRQKKRVEVKALVDTSGRVQQVIFVTSSGDSALDRAAEEAVARYRYLPAHQAGRPIPAWVLVPVNFTPSPE